MNKCGGDTFAEELRVRVIKKLQAHALNPEQQQCVVVSLKKTLHHYLLSGPSSLTLVMTQYDERLAQQGAHYMLWIGVVR